MTRFPWRRRPVAPPPPAVVVHGDDRPGPRPTPAPPIPVGEDRCTCGGTLTPTGDRCITPGDPQ